MVEALQYNLIGTYKLNVMKSGNYLRNVLDVITHWPINQVSELLP